MRYELQVRAYDVMDQVWISTRVLLSPDEPGAQQRPVLASLVQVAGTGESDVLQWARDALVSALEAL